MPAPTLSKAQVADLLRLKERSHQLRADLVIIGAVAFQVHFPGELRYTADIDFAVALDLNEFAELERQMMATGWTRTENREHRWRSASGTLLDLIPAGDKLRKAKEIVWPESKFAIDIRSLMKHYETDSDRLFSDAVLDAKLEDFDMANAFLLGVDLSGLCTDEEKQIVQEFIAALDETKPAWANFVRAGFGIHAEETARTRLAAFTKGFDSNQ